ncbi:unnamed protein product [Penicillium pancosmium]
MFRLLPWPSAIGGDKVMTEEVKMLAPSCAPVNVNVNGLSLPPMLKRKRSSSSATDAPAATKVRTEESTRPVQSVPSMPPTPSPSVAPSVDVAATSVAPSPTATMEIERPPAQAASGKPSVNHIRDTITAQLSLEVLLKHNELRLIDQEIAKCQVALEQLRRCAEIPYPGSAVAGVSADVSSGVGASVLQPGNGPAPMSPAPWGVAEGPYSRHYKQWLIPDPRFDGGLVDATPVSAGKSRPSRTSTGAKMQSLPQIYPPPREKAGPMVIRRKSDGLMVKLVCLDCKRENFSSTQGFINHCRIAHNRNFTSHEAAAIACGAAVDLDDAGVIVGAPRSEPQSAVATPGTVHPLIQSAQLPPSSANPTPPKDLATPLKPSEVNSTAAVATPPTTVKPASERHRQSEPVKTKTNPSFLASPATPHLSALMRQRGLGLNLDKLVEEAKTPVDLSSLSDADSDGEDSTHLSKESSQGPAAARQPMRMPTAQAASERTESRKGIDRAPHEPQLQHEMTPSRPQPPSFLNFPFHGHLPAETREGDGLDHPANLSPHTIESNQAPSLVSDDEDDYEAASDSDSPSSSEADEQEEEFRHIEVADDERNTAQSTTTSEPKPGPSLNPTPQAAPIAHPLKRSRSKRSVLPFDRDEDDQRMSFVHPNQDAPKPKRADPKK